MEKVQERKKASYESKNERFVIKSRNYQRQYAGIYSARLAHSRLNLEEGAKNKYPNLSVKMLSELDEGVQCIVVGTLFKNMVNKPNILKELSEENHLEPQPIKDKYTDATDTVILEDELQRIVLTGNVIVDECITGVTAAVIGKPNKDSGRFVVDDMVYRTLDQEEIKSHCDDTYILFLSGIEVGGKEGSESHISELQLLFDLINGSLGINEASKIVKVIVAGNLLGKGVIERDFVLQGQGKKKRLTEEELIFKSALKQLDDLLFQISINTPLDLVPGPFDPSNYALPQIPLHSCLLPKATSLSSTHMCPNPYNTSIKDREIIGSAGQPTFDIASISSITKAIPILEATLKSTHISPTSPDTMACYPFEVLDPFFMRATPHIYFTANQPEFSYKNYVSDSGHKTLLLSIPSFKTTKSAVLVNLGTLKCQEICVKF